MNIRKILSNLAVSVSFTYKKELKAINCSEPKISEISTKTFNRLLERYEKGWANKTESSCIKKISPYLDNKNEIPWYKGLAIFKRVFPNSTTTPLPILVLKAVRVLLAILGILRLVALRKRKATPLLRTCLKRLVP